MEAGPRTNGLPDTHQLDQDRLRRLIEVGRSLLSELEPEAILDQVLECARDITGARYAALGILDSSRRELESFITSGIDPETHRAIGDLPRGRGVLGVLIDDPRPLRLSDVGQHPMSYGFPTGHPPMRSFLGMPILIRGQAWGNLYLTEKAGGDFDPADEQAAMILAGWAGVAIENARLYRKAEDRRETLERAARALEAAEAVAVAVGAETELVRILELIVKRGRALIDARSVLILLQEGTELVVAASAGEVTSAVGARLPIEGSTSGDVFEHGRTERIADVRARLRISPERFGVSAARAAILAPLIYRGRAVGVLAAFDHMGSSAGFSEDDERTLHAFAASAATAVASAQSVARERLRESLRAAEAERRRWARELHDETLQGLGGLRVVLSTMLRQNRDRQISSVLEAAVEQIEREIENLRSIIAELRPGALDELGLEPALEALLDRVRVVEGVDIDSELDLPELGALESELQTTVYRLVQEALTNVAKHARADRVIVRVQADDEQVEVEVIDDGRGFDPAEVSGGFGLLGMRERVELAGGRLSVTPAQPGTAVRASLPVRQSASAASAEPQSA